MPEKKTRERAQRDKREGKVPSTQAGEFVREEMEHIREGKHGARSAKQAIAIGLSKARRAGVKLAPPEKGKASERTRAQAARDSAKGSESGRPPSPKRSRAVISALKREGQAPHRTPHSRAKPMRARKSGEQAAEARPPRRLLARALAGQADIYPGKREKTKQGTEGEVRGKRGEL
jgi:hypothetical protein